MSLGVRARMGVRGRQREIPRLQFVSAADLFKEFLPLQLPPEEMRNGRKMTIIAEPGADEAKGGLFGE